MDFITNQTIREIKNRKWIVIYIYIYIYIICYSINCEYFNNLNGDENMAGTRIIAGMGTGTWQICTFSYSSPYPIKKVEHFPYHTHTQT